MRPSNLAAVARFSKGMPTAVQPRRRNSASISSAAQGNRSSTSANARSIAGASTAARFFGLPRELRANLANPLPRDAETVADFGQRVLPPVAPTVIADQDFRVAVVRIGGENLDQLLPRSSDRDIRSIRSANSSTCRAR